MRKWIVLIILILCSICLAFNPYRLINSFNAGELSELLSAREDLSKYHAGASIMENMIVLPQGGIEKRPGTKYVAQLLSGDGTQFRLIPFEYSVSDSYVIAISDANIFFFYSE